MIEQPVALVTGASRGIGRAVAQKLALEGYALALASRSVEGMKETAKSIAVAGGKSLEIPVDLRDLRQIDPLADTVLAEWGRVDVLVNNAGILHAKPFLELEWDEFQEMLDVNIRSVFALTQRIVPGMIARKSGAIVNIASLAGKHGFKTGTGYTASKFALRGFAASLMQELREHDIRVITIFPGSVDTRLIGHHPQAPKNETMLKAEDVAYAVYAAISVDQRAMMSEIDIRPSNPKR